MHLSKHKLQQRTGIEIPNLEPMFQMELKCSEFQIEGFQYFCLPKAT